MVGWVEWKLNYVLFGCVSGYEMPHLRALQLVKRLVVQIHASHQLSGFLISMCEILRGLDLRKCIPTAPLFAPLCMQCALNYLLHYYAIRKPNFVLFHDIFIFPLHFLSLSLYPPFQAR